MSSGHLSLKYFPEHIINKILDYLPLEILEQLNFHIVNTIIMDKIKKELFLPEIFNPNVYKKYKQYFDELLLKFCNVCADEYMKPVDNIKEGLVYVYEILIKYESIRPYYLNEKKKENEPYKKTNDRASIMNARDHLNQECAMSMTFSMSLDYSMKGSIEFTKASIVKNLFDTFLYLLDLTIDYSMYPPNINTKTIYIINSINIKVYEFDKSKGQYLMEHFPVVKNVKLF